MPNFSDIKLMIAAVGGNTQGLVPCGNGSMCTFADLFILVGRIIQFLIFTVALPMCALAITIGGVMIATSGPKPANKEKGKAMIYAAIFGLVLTLASYMIVDTILTTFTDKSVQQLQTDLNVNAVKAN